MTNDPKAEHYVAVTDYNFLPQVLALYESMVCHAGPFMLWILCLDDKAKHVMERLNRPGIRLVAHSEIETPQLIEIKRKRNLREYCWTLKPATPKIVFDRDSTVERVTYLDADMWFLKSPASIFDEFEASRKSILITDHAFDVENDRSMRSGQYCAHFMTFLREKSETVRQWWEARCLEWCFARCEKGKFADQKYLDDWPKRFSKDVHVLQQLDLLLGPWNTSRFHYTRGAAWHFHGLRLLDGDTVLLHPGYSVPKDVEKNIYVPYLNALRRALDLIGGPIVQSSSMSISHLIPPSLRSFFRRVLKVTLDYRSKNFLHHREIPTDV